MFEFIQWCFKDETSGITTLIVLAMLGTGLVRVISAIRGHGDCDCDDEDVIQDLIAECNEQIEILEAKLEGDYKDDKDQVQAFRNIIKHYEFMIARLTKKL